MLTSTRRGWWPALEPALLAFTVVVCGGAALLAQSRASVLDRDHSGFQTDTSSSIHFAATATSDDSLDDGDDGGDDGLDAIAAPIILTTDDDFGRPIIQTEFDVAPTLWSAQLAVRGPPNRAWKQPGSELHPQDSPLAFAVAIHGNTLPLAQSRASTIDSNHPASTPGSDYWTLDSPHSVDDGDDDGDDDDDGDGVDDIADAIAAPTLLMTDDDSSRPVFRPELDITSTLWSEQLAPRGPPDRTLNDSERRPADSSDVDVDDDDDDDDDSCEAGGSPAASKRAPTSILNFSGFNDLFSLASDDCSLRAPPR